MTNPKKEPRGTPRSSVKSLGKGYMRGIILAMLADQPRYGYEILDEMAKASNGWRPSSGTIYPILHEMHQHGLISKKIDEEEGRQRIVYKLRTKGKAQLENAAIQHAHFVTIMRSIFGKHAGPRFPNQPAFDIDEGLLKLQHSKYLLREVNLLQEDTGSDPKHQIEILEMRLQLLEEHEKIVQNAIQELKDQIERISKSIRKLTF